MKEDLLQYIWKMKVISSIGLKTTSGIDLEILDFGTLNDDQGPDFLNGRVLLDGVEFAGSIEIHVNGSHWLLHKHGESRQYDNVILHVVFENDVQINNQMNQPIPTLELKELINESLLITYRGLMESSSLIPCEKQLDKVDSLLWIIMKDRMFAERLDRKSEEIRETFQKNSFNWEETFYQYLFKYAAMGVNSINFLELAQSVPLKIVRKIGNDPFVLEAIFFGQANPLEKTDNNYLRELRGEFEYQKLKFGLKLNYFQMKFSRMRPANFPTIRLIQLTALLANHQNLFRKVMESESVKDISQLLVMPSNAGQFKNGAAHQAHTGFGSVLIKSIVVNVVVPVMYNYGRYLDDQNLINKAKRMMEELSKENNKITRIWEGLNVENKNAYDSQALIQLYKQYCSAKKCLNCGLSSKTLLSE
ncbi:MAG: DUF2851 family protein [Flavobacteriales bacterium]|nr:DUF2851 family protein [Flavobacteriales bacterium]